MKKIFITGINGQIGSYLAKDLLENSLDTVVHGMVRRSSTINTGRIDDLYERYNGSRLFLHYGDMTDPLSIENLISTIKPDEIYNLAAQSQVRVSFDIPVYTAQCDALGELYVLESMRKHCPKAKLYQASTSEIFGGQANEMPEDGFSETTPFHPRSPYGVAKLYAYWITKNYRESYGLFASNGLLFNSESPNRGETFVTRKITMWLGNLVSERINGEDNTPIPLNELPKLYLGNLYAVRDWGHAEDSAKAMQLILQQEKPDDYVIATGETHSVKEFIEKCIEWVNTQIDVFQYDKRHKLKLEWVGSGVDEKGMINGVPMIQINPKYFRPAEVDILKGNAEKIKKLGWKRTYTFEALIDDMMSYDADVF
jgi:GDPmannose 4,6-dehydratase